MQKDLDIKKKIGIFTGNRGEFGILFPIIYELDRDYEIVLYVSGSHVLKGWDTINDINNKIEQYGLGTKIVRIDLDEQKENYFLSLSDIYVDSIGYLTNDSDDYLCNIILGDRVETFGFAIASYFSKIPIFHIGAGDINTNSYFDTNIRHSITKLACIFFPFNSRGEKYLLKSGEEDWRVNNIGMLSFDYDRLGLMPKKSELLTEFEIDGTEIIIVCTYHPSHLKSPQENLDDFLMLVECLELQAPVKCKIIVTYPNNDPGSEEIINHLNTSKGSLGKRNAISAVVSLGTEKYLAIQKYLKAIIIGNSSSGLLETAFYATPTINIGDRQNDRFKGENVLTVPLDQTAISECLEYCILNYDRLKNSPSVEKNLFGSGEAGLKLHAMLRSIGSMSREKLLTKKIVE